MISLNGTNIYAMFAVGSVFMGFYFWMLANYQRILASNFKHVAWIGGLLILTTGAKLMMPVLSLILDGAGIHDEEIIPWMFGVMIVLCVTVIAFQLYKLRRLRKGLYEAPLRRS